MNKPYHASGRINLIGEHLDYNGGLVLPTTINLGIYLWLKPSSDKWLFSSDNHETIVIEDKDLFSETKDWVQYPISVLRYLKDQHFTLPQTYEFIYQSNLPEGSGLSSSAAMLVVTLKAFNEELKLNWDNLTIAKISQFIENQYIGVNCGIMDSYVISYNLWNSALLIDCKNLIHKEVNLNLGNHKILILDTKIPRSLKHSAYNDRRTSCEEALKQIQHYKNITTLAEAEITDLEFLQDDSIKKRARHVITEQARVKNAFEAIHNQDFIILGQLMNASHQSLKYDYEVSCDALDFLVENLQNQPGCLGARMTGAGFGGCAIALINKNFNLELLPSIQHAYFQKFNIQPNIFIGKEECSF